MSRHAHRIVISLGDPAGVGAELLYRLIEKKKSILIKPGSSGSARLH